MADPDPETLELATRFRAARRLAEVSLGDAAQQLGVSISTLNRIERGLSKLRQPYIEWAIDKWKTPPWLLPGDAPVRRHAMPGGELARRLATPPQSSESSPDADSGE